MFLLQLIFFLYSLFGDKKALMVIFTILAFIIPDEIPVIDEIIYLIISIRTLID